MGRDQSGISAADYLWIVQQKLILDIAKREPCVIVGRCADYILRDMEHVWNIFIHAPLEDRARRIVEKYGERDTSPEKRLRDKDKKRSVNYKYYTDQGMGQIPELPPDSGQQQTGELTSVQILSLDSCTKCFEKGYAPRSGISFSTNTYCQTNGYKFSYPSSSRISS